MHIYIHIYIYIERFWYSCLLSSISVQYKYRYRCRNTMWCICDGRFPVRRCPSLTSTIDRMKGYFVLDWSSVSMLPAFNCTYIIDKSDNGNSAIFSLRWRHNDHDSVSNHQPHGCLLNRLLRRRSKKTSKLRVTGLCVGNSPGPVNSPHKEPVTRKMFPFDDVIMVLAEAGN